MLNQGEAFGCSSSDGVNSPTVLAGCSHSKLGNRKPDRGVRAELGAAAAVGCCLHLRGSVCFSSALLELLNNFKVML